MGGGDDEVVEEADLRDFGEVGEAAGEIKVAIAWFEVAGGVVYVISTLRFLDNPLAAFVDNFANKAIEVGGNTRLGSLESRAPLARQSRPEPA